MHTHTHTYNIITLARAHAQCEQKNSNSRGQCVCAGAMIMPSITRTNARLSDSFMCARVTARQRVIEMLRFCSILFRCNRYYSVFQ